VKEPGDTHCLLLLLHLQRKIKKLKGHKNLPQIFFAKLQDFVNQASDLDNTTLV